MKRDHSQLPIVVVDDSQEDQLLMKAAMRDAKIPNPISFVKDGQELLDRLRGGQEAEPGVILLDLNMPRLGGKDTLRALRADPQWGHLIVLIVSTSAFEEEVRECYRLGANAVLVKPFDYEEFVALMGATCGYWLKRVEIPPVRRGAAQESGG